MPVYVLNPVLKTATINRHSSNVFGDEPGVSLGSIGGLDLLF